MRKLLSILVAAVFVMSTGSAFAASHMAAASDKKADATTSAPMTKEEKKQAKAMKKQQKKAAKAKMAPKENDTMKKDASVK
jgi:hypothetical protein